VRIAMQMSYSGGFDKAARQLADRIRAFAEAGVWMVNAQLLGEDHTAQLRSVEILRELVA